MPGKKSKNKGGKKEETFYFPGQKSQELGGPLGETEKNEDESEDEDEAPIAFKADQTSASPVIPEIVLPPDADLNDIANGLVGPDGHERGQWTNKWDFLFSCISVSVGLGNVWRFPYLCYKNGGGAFLIVYFLAMTFCGIPVFFQEVAIGQYLGSGGMTLIAQLCPILKGVGIATMVLVFYLDIYYCVIIAWSFFYLIASFTAIPDLPWDTCSGSWNTPTCYHASENMTENDINIAHHNKTAKNLTTTPVEEFWEHRVLRQNAGLEFGLGAFQWELVGCLFLSWVTVYLIIYKGLHSSGKIIWFTALFPYFVMFILLGRALTLPGAWDGLSFFVAVDWDKLFEARTWIDGATQIFFAYSVGMGALPALGSYNKFHHDCYKDALITCVVNTMTGLIAGVLVFSILGYMAHIQEATIKEVVKSGPGLVFLTYPDLVLNLPGSVIWAVIFFIMLLVLGVDSEFCNVEALVTGIVDNWPEKLLKHRRVFTIGICIFMFALGIPMCTEGGVYLFQLIDFYAASGLSLLWVCFFQTIAISWFFGAQRFADCVEQMTGRKPLRFWFYCWKFFAPIVMICVFLFFVFSYKPVTYGEDYDYPKWAEILGLCISFSSMIWVPAYALYYLVTQPGTFRERLIRGITTDISDRRQATIAYSISQKNLRDGFTPKIKRLQNLAQPQTLHLSESGVGLLQRNSSEYEMGRLHRPESFIAQPNALLSA